MANKCQVCLHPKTEEIDKRIAQGGSTHSIAKDYDGLDYQNIWRHGQNHLPETLIRSLQKKDEKHAENVLDGINDLLERTKSILDQAEAEGQKTTALAAIREVRSSYEFLAKVAVKLEEYRRADRKDKQAGMDDYISDGLEALSTEELKVLIQLMAKVHSQDSDYELSPEVRLFMESVELNNHYDNNTNNNKNFDSDSVRNGGSQPKNFKMKKDSDPDITEWDDDLDLDFDDLDLNKSNQIPSEESDPEWLREERKRNGLY